MATFHNLVDNIRGFCNAADPAPTPEVVDWATRYGELCREANTRLRRCSDLLRRGMRGEALHEAEQMPPLLEVVAALDFPELPVWEAACATHGLSRPQRVSIELASELNESYAAQQAVEPMLRLHRTAAMAPAPLPERLAIIKELIKLDPGTAFWRQDMESLEKVRLGQLRSDLGRAVKAADLTQVQVIEREIGETNWRVQVPDDLRNTAQLAKKDFRQKQGIVRLREMLPALNEAYGAMAFEEASPLVDQWAATIAEYGVVVPPDLFETVSPIESWVFEERDRRARQLQFDQDCEHLDQLLQQNTMASLALSTSMRSLRATGLPVPEQLERRYRTVMEQRELVIARRKRRNMALAGLAAVVVIGGVSFGGRQLYRNQEAGRFATRITELTVAEKLTDAAAVVEEAHSAGYGQFAEVTKAASQLTDAQATEAQRVEKLTAELDRIAADVKDQKLPIDFTSADKLAKTADERLKILDLKDARDSISQTRAKAQAADAEAKLASLTDIVKSSEEALSQGDLNRVETLRREAQPLLSSLNSPSLPDAIRTSTVALDGRLSIVDGRVRQQRQASRAVQELVAASRSADTLAAELPKVGEALGNPARAAVLAETAKLLPQWHAVEGWADLSQSIDEALAKGDLARLAQARDKLQEYVAGHADAAIAAEAQPVLGYVNAVITFSDNSSEWRRAFTTVLESRPMSSWMQVRTKRGTFYVVDDKSIKSSVVNDKLSAVHLKYIIGETADPEQPAVKEVVLGADELLKPDTAAPERSEQHELAVALLRELDRTDLTNWQSLHSRLSKLILGADTVDPVLRGILVQLLMDSQAPDGMAVSAGTARAREALTRLRASEASWMNPLDERTAVVRDRCKTWLTDTKDIPGLLAETPELWRSAYSKSRLQLLTKGVLLVDGSGRSVQLAKSTEAGLLYAIAVDDGGKATWTSIGEVVGGVPKLSDQARAVPDGSMVFVAAADAVAAK